MGVLGEAVFAVLGGAEAHAAHGTAGGGGGEVFVGVVGAGDGAARGCFWPLGPLFPLFEGQAPATPLRLPFWP